MKPALCLQIQIASRRHVIMRGNTQPQLSSLLPCCCRYYCCCELPTLEVDTIYTCVAVGRGGEKRKRKGEGIAEEYTTVVSPIALRSEQSEPVGIDTSMFIPAPPPTQAHAHNIYTHKRKPPRTKYANTRTHNR